MFTPDRLASGGRRVGSEVHHIRMNARTVQAALGAISLGLQSSNAELHQLSVKSFGDRVMADFRLTGIDASQALALADALVEQTGVDDARVEHGWSKS